jgi:L-threonylcarbamoyladenylate synthase
LTVDGSPTSRKTDPTEADRVFCKGGGRHDVNAGSEDGFPDRHHRQPSTVNRQPSTANPLPHRLFLFDVDGTLVDAGGAGKRSFTSAFEDVLGSRDAFAGITMSGRTDPWIFRTAAKIALGRDATPGEEAAFIERYLGILVDGVASSPAYRVLPGVPDVLHALSTRPSCLLGLATGNYERGARLKLERGGLNAFFAFGGYGSDDVDRAVLTRRAIERGTAAAGGPARTVVVGDSPHDAAAARANGVEVALVGSGWTPHDELRALAPDFFFESMEDAPAVVAALLGIAGGIRATTGDLGRAVECVRSGGVLGYPTATLYGLGGDALDPAVAGRVARIKGGREAPFLVLASGPDEALGLAREPSATARRLASAFWPGPLTLVLHAADRVPAHLVGPEGTVAVRVDGHSFCLALTAAAGRPILSTSANRSGGVAPGRAGDVEQAVVAATDLFVADPSPLGGRASTLARVDGDRVTVLREGAIPAQDVEGRR